MASLLDGSRTWDLSAVDDPSDWEAPFEYLRPLDASLRCEICMAIYTAPVSMKECGHVFCSSCVRTCINQAGGKGNECPTCRTKAFDSHLQPHAALEAAAESWKAARGKLFELQRSGSAAVSRSSGAVASGSTSPSRQERKRKTRADSPGASQGALTPAGAVGESARGSRAASRRASARLGGGAESPVVIDSDGDDCYSPSSSRGPAKRQAGASRSPVKNVALYNGNPSPRDTFACPICEHHFTQVALDRHLEKGCEPGRGPPTAAESGLAAAGGGPGNNWLSKGGGKPGSTASSTRSNKKLTRSNYGLLTEKQLKEQLLEHKLAVTGTRERMTERLRQWVNLFNANLDASEKNRKSLWSLQRDLQEWERGQDAAERSKSKGGALPEKKAKTWASDNSDQFAQLIAQARVSNQQNRQAHQRAPDAESGSSKNGSAAAHAAGGLAANGEDSQHLYGDLSGDEAILASGHFEGLDP